MESKASVSKISSGPPRRTTIPGGGLIVFCLAVFALVTYVALKQPPRLDPFARPALSQKLFSPLERNAFLRLPVISGRLNDIFVAPGSGHIWVAGDNGLLLVSPDNGATWQQRVLTTVQQTRSLPAVAPPEPPSAPKLKSERSPLNWLVPDAHAARPSEKSYDTGNAPPNIKQQAPSAPKIDPKDPKNFPATQQPVQRQAPPEANKTPFPPVEKAEIRPDLYAIFFQDANKGWIVGQAGALFKTTNAGENWELIASGTEADLSAIAFADPQHGWIWGKANTVLETVDSGEHWRARLNLQAPEPRSVHFVEPQRGWAVGKDGALLATGTAGAEWRQVGRLEKGLATVHFFDAQRGWGADQAGGALRTQDGGQTWTSAESDARAILSSVHFSDDTQGWAVGRNGLILSTHDGGRHWISQSRGAWLSSVHFTDRARGWAVGQGGTMLSSADSGRSWRAQRAGTGLEITSVYFTTRDQGWAVEENGAILHTTDGGATWNKQHEESNQYLACLHFADGAHGWAVGAYGAIHATRDGGATWTRQASGVTAALLSVYFTDPENGWAVGEQGTILTTTNGGAAWTRQAGGTSARLRSIHFTDRGTGWAAGDNGTILYTSNGGATWAQQASGTIETIRSIYFFNREWGWAVGRAGVMLKTANGGAAWNVVPTRTKATLRSVYFSDPDHGWVTGDGGTLLWTTDGGQSWRAPAYNRWPGLWYWIVCAVLAGVSLFVVRQRGRPEQESQTVADMLASDRPLAEGDPDPLDLHSISAGLARFIANRNTEPPLTIAVTGEWGTGKSSLMNLLYHDLKHRRFQPVWFNAWHHQKGEQLLASLYAHIQRQAVPPLFHPAGALFRLRLVLRRSRRHWPVVGAVVLLVLAVYPFLEGTLLALAGALADLAKALFSGDKQNVRDALDLGAIFKAIPNHLDKLMAAVLASPAVAAVLRAIRSFGLSPQSLIAFNAADGTKKSDIDPGARARFAQEFQDVAASLDLGAMVLFIDDLDRCSKENVVEILETINFLAVSGRCFIILGMARQWVETCVALQFKELAEESDTDDDDQNGQLQRRKFARQYLEKLINIEVPVPVPPPEKTQALLAPVPPPVATRLQRLGTSLGQGLNKYLPVLALALLMLAAWGLKDWFKSPPAAPPPAAQEVQLLPGAGEPNELLLHDGKLRLPLDTRPDGSEKRNLEVILKSPAEALENGIPIGVLGSGEPRAELVLRYRKKSAAPSSAPSQAADRSLSSTPPEEKSVFFQPGAGQTGRAGLWWSLLAGLGLAAIGGFYLLQRPQRFTSDSKNFRDALAIWHPWIIFTSRTPRTIKRFLNRLRYVAMRLQPQSPPPRRAWQRLKNRFLKKAMDHEPAAASEPGIEPILVALGAIFHVNPAWVKDTSAIGRLFSADAAQLATMLKQSFPALTESSKTADALAQVIARFKTEFNLDGGRLIQHQAHFLEVLAETAK